MPALVPRVLFASLAAAFAFGASACHSTNANEQAASANEQAASAPMHAAPHAEWSYAAESGPEHWSDLDAEFVACGAGKHQSPIDLVSTRGEHLANVVFNYQPCALEIFDNGHTVQVNYASGSSIELDGERYELEQFHMHVPSEHRLAGAQFPAELHLVHEADNGVLAVVGILIQNGSDNAALAPYFDSLPSQVGPPQTTDARIDAEAFLPEDRTSFRYAGSLTTPPCSEGVRWCVLRTPIAASAAQIGAFASLHGGNNRPVQPLGERTVTLDITP